jgi:cytochrome b561
MKVETMPVLRYNRTAMVLHWLIAALIALNIALIWSVDLLPDDIVRPVIDTHKSIGITVLGLVVLRLLWRTAHRPPAFPAAYAAWERTAAHAAHIALYVLILALPLSGWMHDSAWSEAAKFPMKLFYLIPFPRIGLIADLAPNIREPFHDISGHVHVWLSYALYAMFFLHVAGAMKHQWFDKQPELERMLPARGDVSPAA